MAWVPGPTLSKARMLGSGFTDEQDGSFKVYGGYDIWGIYSNKFDVLANDINEVEFVEDSSAFSFGQIAGYS